MEVAIAGALLLLAAGFTQPIWSAQSPQLEKERQTRCISNVKQLGQGLHLYAGDHDDHYALATTLDERRGEYRSNRWHCFPWNWRITWDS